MANDPESLRSALPLRLRQRLSDPVLEQGFVVFHTETCRPYARASIVPGLTLLKKCRDNQSTSIAAEFTDAMQAADWETARRLAHSLKAVSCTRGIIEVGDARVERQAATEDRDAAHSQAALAHLLQHLRQATAGLAAISGSRGDFTPFRQRRVLAG